MTRLRVRFTKRGKVRFVGHRDVARVWERALRRARVPVAYSEGFSPHPRLHFGLALPVGCESDAEYLDVDVVAPLDDSFADRVTACLPAGMEVTAVGEVDPRAESLQAGVVAVEWEFTVAAAAGELRRSVDAALATRSLPVEIERKGRPVAVDLRPQILRLDLEPADGEGARLCAELATQPRGVRPTELLAAFDPPLHPVRIRRIEQWMDVDGVRRPPLPAGPSPSPVAVAAGSVRNT